MRREPVASALGPLGFLAAVWLGLFLGRPETPLYWHGAAVGAGMWAAGWCAGRAGRAVLRDAAERIRAAAEKAKEQMAKTAAEGTSATPAAQEPSGPAGRPAAAPRRA